MIIPFAFLFLAAGYLCYKSKNNVSLVEVDHLKTSNEQIEEDDLYRDLEDLFI